VESDKHDAQFNGCVAPDGDNEADRCSRVKEPQESVNENSSRVLLGWALDIEKCLHPRFGTYKGVAIGSNACYSAACFGVFVTAHKEALVTERCLGYDAAAFGCRSKDRRRLPGHGKCAVQMSVLFK